MIFSGFTNLNYTYDGMSGAGRACPPAGRPPGTGGAAPDTNKNIFFYYSHDLPPSYLIPPPGLFGIAGAGLPPAGAGGGPRLDELPSDPYMIT